LLGSNLQGSEKLTVEVTGELDIRIRIELHKKLLPHFLVAISSRFSGFPRLRNSDHAVRAMSIMKVLSREIGSSVRS
jgi:hypothetical protein